MLCPSCQSSNDESATYCTNCGLKLAAERSNPAVNSDEVSNVFDLWASGHLKQESSIKGKVIDGKYQVESQIGSGGMGAVFRARRLLIGDLVAIKILHLSKGADSYTTERFRREAQAAARLKHPNAVSIYDFGITADSMQYLVMELVEGESLRNMIKRDGPMPASLSAEIISQVCSALDEAHRHGVIHRDIKPDNIFISTTVGGTRVKVLDFGIAKLRDPVANNLTQTGSVMGTPHYMSPEQCLGEELDNRSDIYSLGVVLYEMLTGSVPFNSPTSTAVVIQHVNQPPVPPRHVRPDITPAIESVVLHALEKRRELRPQSAGMLASEFKAALTTPPATQQARQPHKEPPPLPISAQNSEPTLVFRTPSVPQSVSGAMPPVPAAGAQPSSSTARVIILTALATILLVSLGSGIVWLASVDDKAEGRRSETNRNVNDQAQSNGSPNVNIAASSTPASSANYGQEAAVNANTTTTTPVVNSSAARSQVMAVLNRWAESLRRQDLNDNLSCYADHLDVFYQLYDVDKEKVRSSRQLSFARYYTSMDMQLSDVQVTFDESGLTATIAYDTSYDWRGGPRFLTGKSHNEMVLSKIAGQWLITSEKHIQTYYEDKSN